MRRLFSLAAGLALLAPAATAQTTADLAAVVVAELQSQCAAGSTISVAPDAITVNADGTADVEVAKFTCRWEFGTHPFCGARNCTIWTYAYRNGRFEQIGARLQ
ncbi:MAG: hypothetical protein AAF366_12615 [Pseudomonadota bacterium]